MSWYLAKCGDDFVIIQNGFRLQNRSGEQVGPVIEVSSGINDTIMFKCKGEATGFKFSRSSLLSPGPNNISTVLSQATSNKEFVSLLTKNTSILKRRRNVKRLNACEEQISSKRIRMPEVNVIDVENPQREPSTVCVVDKETESCYVGRFDVGVLSLSEPPQNMKCREINSDWVNTIKRQLKASPTHLYVTLPCLLAASQVPDTQSFREAKLCTYTKYTLGGNHLRTALQDILLADESGHFEHLRTVTIDLYAGLTSHQARRLGSLHNKKLETNQPSLLDRVKHCRRILYEMNGRSLDEGEPPRSTAEWKSRCQVELAEENKTIGSLSTVFHLAQYSLRCWNLMNTIVTDGTSKVTGQTVFQKFQGLSEAYRWELLNKVSCGEMTLEAAGRDAHKAKKMELIRSTFNFLTKSSSWAEAREKYPNHSNEDVLKRKFLNMKWDRKTVPTEFALWCKKATENTQVVTPSEPLSVVINVYRNGSIVSHTDSAVKQIKHKYEQRILDELKQVTTTSVIQIKDEPSSEDGTD